MSKSLTVDNQTIKFQIWDTAGQERVSPLSLSLSLSLFLSLTCIHIHIYADTLPSSMSSRAVICVCVLNVKPFYLSLSLQYRSLLPVYYRNAAAAIIVYDITNEATFEVLQEWITELNRLGPANIVLAIAGNKCDLEETREVSEGWSLLSLSSSSPTNSLSLSLCFSFSLFLSL